MSTPQDPEELVNNKAVLADVQEQNVADKIDQVATVLKGSSARFVLQWDEQVIGTVNAAKIDKDFDSFPKPPILSEFPTHYCSICEVTWLVGEMGEEAARDHPYHRTSPPDHAGKPRSLLVFIDGALRFGVESDEIALGVFFGKDSTGRGSKFNVAERLAKNPTTPKAEIEAAFHAIQQVRDKVLSDRWDIFQNLEGGQDLLKDFSRDKHLRLIIVSDSKYLVDAACEDDNYWTKDDEGKPYNTISGNRYETPDWRERLWIEVESLAKHGVEVFYYHVSPDYVNDAYGLARSCM
ncbi:uncharacterized protein RAG0_01486 [Rhynchosporium agropyri]|uniref:RNase H type-1 domain-containing protein n=1 Tax=Rhynchosporium agropyri TaxID=914238 RepID=A0A1E1JXD5_9HELO|nr:uncharacterized protein RAG0_01486 [Rhynchosporium agropyri]